MRVTLPTLRVETLFYREAPKDLHVEAHSHVVHQWYLCVHGRLAIELEGREFVLGPEESVLVRPGTRREPRAEGRAPGYLVLIFAAPELDLDPVCHRLLQLPHELRADLHALLAELRRPCGAESEHLCAALLIHLLIGQRRAALAGRPVLPALNARSHHAAVEQAEAFLRANLGRSLTRAEVARAACVSEPHLARLFKATTGQTVLGRLTELRVARAKELLRESTLNVTQVAGEVGFTSFSHFAKIFREAVGVSPSDYRRAGGSAFG